MTIITLSQKTENDMTSWSDAVEEERELLLANVNDCLRGLLTLMNYVKFKQGLWDSVNGFIVH